MVSSGEIECAFLFPQTDPETTVAMTIYYSGIVFAYKKSRVPGGVAFNSLSDLKKYKIGAHANSGFSVKLL